MWRVTEVRQVAGEANLAEAGVEGYNENRRRMMESKEQAGFRLSLLQAQLHLQVESEFAVTGRREGAELAA